MSVTEPLPQRPLWPALKNGLRLRCPNCGVGRALFAFVKVHDTCGHCAEALHHHRADDMPPYITILIVGHIIVPMVLSVEMAYAPATWVHWLLWLPLTTLICLAMLPRVKAAVIAIQWANRMHGFGDVQEEEIEPWQY